MGLVRYIGGIARSLLFALVFYPLHLESVLVKVGGTL